MGGGGAVSVSFQVFGPGAEEKNCSAWLFDVCFSDFFPLWHADGGFSLQAGSPVSPLAEV